MNNVKVFTGQELAETTASAQAPVNTGMAEQSRAITEAQASLQLAKMFPRDVTTARVRILTECKRTRLAAQAEYSFTRGGTVIKGPSIRLLEVVARNWQNLQFGFIEVGRNSTESEIQAFCWDLETNTKVVKHFQVRHWRDTKKGGYAIEGERDKYELVANMAQRRVRACIEGIIPGDILEQAVEQCRETLKNGGGEPLEDRVRKMVVSFSDIGVSKEMLEDRLGHTLDVITVEELADLHPIFNTIKSNPKARFDFFQVKSEQLSKDKIQDDIEPAVAAPKTTAPKKKKKPKTAPAKKNKNEIDALLEKIEGFRQSKGETVYNECVMATMEKYEGANLETVEQLKDLDKALRRCPDNKQDEIL